MTSVYQVQSFLPVNLNLPPLSPNNLLSASVSLSRIYAVPLQPAHHADTKQHATHLHSFPCHTGPAAAAAATSCWSSSRPTTCVAVSAVRAIWDPVRQRRLSPTLFIADNRKRCLCWGFVCSSPTARTTFTQLRVWCVDRALSFFFYFWCYGAPWLLATGASCSLTGRALQNETFGPEALTQPEGGKLVWGNDMSYSEDEELNM